MKSPVRRIHKVKTGKTIKNIYTDEELEVMRDSCEEIRDVAIIDILASTGMRVGEMVLFDKFRQHIRIGICRNHIVWHNFLLKVTGQSSH